MKAWSRNTWPLKKYESENLAALNSLGIESTLLFITATGLEKSILDATSTVRRFLQDRGVHNYASQRQGGKHRVKLKAIVFTGKGRTHTTISLYRPSTK